MAPAGGRAYVYGGARIDQPDNWGFGNMVVIDHGTGYASVLVHLRDLLVPNGSIVAARQPIGTLGTTGNSGNEHLHFQVSQLMRRPDPASETHRGIRADLPPPPFGQPVPLTLCVRALSSGFSGHLDTRFLVDAAGGAAWDLAHWYEAP